MFYKFQGCGSSHELITCKVVGRLEISVDSFTSGYLNRRFKVPKKEKEYAQVLINLIKLKLFEMNLTE